jgi:MFS family permease
MMTFHTPRAAITLVFVSFGAAIGAWAGAIPQVASASGIDNFQLGLGLTILTLATVAVMSLGGAIGRCFSNRAVLLFAIPAFALSTGLLLVSNAPWLFFASLVLFGASIGLTEVFMNAEASAIEHDLRRPIFTAFHGSASAGLPVFAIASSIVSIKMGTFATSLLVVAAFALAWGMVFLFVPPRNLTRGRESSIAILSSRGPLIIMGLAVGLSISCETAAVFWSAKLLNEQAPSLAAIAGLGTAFYGICNAGMRFYGDRLRAQYGEMTILLTSIVLAMAGFAILGLSTAFAVSVVAFALAGLGLSMLCPCLFNMAASQMPANRAAALGFISMIAGAPRIMAPWLFGWIAASQSTSFAFGLCTFALATAFGLVMLLKNTSLEAAEKAA